MATRRGARVLMNTLVNNVIPQEGGGWRIECDGNAPAG